MHNYSINSDKREKVTVVIFALAVLLDIFIRKIMSDSNNIVVTWMKSLVNNEQLGETLKTAISAATPISIYWVLRIGITVDMMHDAYVDKFRKHDRDYFQKMEEFITYEPDKNNRHFCKYYNKKNPYGFVWTKDKLLCTQFCPLFYQRFQKPILVHVNKSLVELLKAVQVYVIEKVERMNLCGSKPNIKSCNRWNRRII